MSAAVELRQGADELAFLVDVIGGPLRCESSVHGEGDAWRAVPGRVRSRLGGVGVVTRTGGVPVDEACERWNDRHGSNLDLDGFVEVWVGRAVAALDARRDARRGVSESEAVRPDEPELPEWCTVWLSSLLCDAKREYAAAVAWAMYGDLPLPERPAGAGWAEKVERKIANRWQAAVARGEVW